MTQERDESNHDADAIRTAVAEALAGEGLSQGALAREAGVSATTVSQFLSDTYRGDVAGVAARLARWLAGRDERAALPPALRSDVLVETGVKAAIWSKLRFTHQLGSMSMVALKPGLGKTCTARAYAAAHNNVWLATMLEGAGGATMALRAICGDLGMKWHGGEGVVELNRALCAKLEGRGGLLIIDEAQHLKPAGLEAVRQIHDKARVGVALVGHDELGVAISGLKQLDSRMAWKLEGAELDAGDVALVGEAFGVTDSPALTLLEACALNDGGLRDVVNSLRRAWEIAYGHGRHVQSEDVAAAVAERASRRTVNTGVR